MAKMIDSIPNFHEEKIRLFLEKFGYPVPKKNESRPRFDMIVWNALTHQLDQIQLLQAELKEAKMDLIRAQIKVKRIMRERGGGA